MEGLMSYDAWKLATPPEYEFLGSGPDDEELCPACLGEKVLPAIVMVSDDITESEVHDVPCPLCCNDEELKRDSL
jgi:hypothetical protein